MDEILYLEADEEITSVVDKLKGLEAKTVGLVVPKGSNIAQSMVSLKLLKKEAQRLEKEVSIVTSDEVGQNLASQLGLTVYADAKGSQPISVKEESAPENAPIEIDMTKEEPVAAEELPEDFKIHRYDDEELTAQESLTKQEAVETAESAEPIAEASVARAAEETVPEKTSKEVEKTIIIEKEKVIQPSEFTSRPVEGAAEQGVMETHHLEAERPVRFEDHISPVSKKKKSWKKPVIISVISLVIVVLALGALEALSHMSVNLNILADPIQKDVEVTVAKDNQAIDFNTDTIPGVQISKDENTTKSFNASGSKETGDPSKGTLTLKNDSGVDISINSGATITSTSGIAFTLDQAVTVPKAQLNVNGDKVLGQVTGAVTAKNSGTSGNLSASSSYVVNGQTHVSVTGATTGGTTKQVKVVTKTDISNAQRSLQDQGVADLTKQITPSSDQVLLDGASVSEINDYSTDKNAGDVADTFNAKATVKITAILYRSDDLKQVVTQSVDKSLTDGKSLLLSDADMITPSLKSADINVGKLTLTAALKSFVGPNFDLNVQKKSWRLKPVSKIKSALTSIQGMTVNQVTVTPGFSLPIGPLLTRNMDVKVEYTQK